MSVLISVLPGTGNPLWSLDLLVSAVQKCTAVFLAAAFGLWLLLALAFLLYRSPRTGLALFGYGSLCVIGAWLLRDRLYLVADSMVYYQSVEVTGNVLIGQRAPLASTLLEFLAGILRPWGRPSTLFAVVSVLSGWLVGLFIWRTMSRGGKRGLGAAVALALVFLQPMSFIFYGHVETYPLLMAVFALTLVVTRRDLDRGKLSPSTLLLLVFLGFMHFMMLLLLLPLGAWFWSRRFPRRGGMLGAYVGMLFVATAVLLAVPPLRVYTLIDRTWTAPDFADYLWDVLNGWFLLFFPLGLLAWWYRRTVLETDFGKILGLTVVSYALFPLLGMFALGMYRDLDLLSPAFVALCFFVALGMAETGLRPRVYGALAAGVVLLAAFQVHQICPAGAVELEKQLDRGAMDSLARGIGTEMLSFHYERHGDLESAERVMRKAIANQPGNMRLYGPLGDIQLARGDTTGAIESLTRSMSSWRAVRTAPVLGELLTETGEPERAIEILRPMRAELIKSSAAAAALAVAYFRAGFPDSMLAVTRERLAVDPLDHVAHFNAASGWAVQGEYEAALAELEKAVTLDPDNVIYHRRIVQVLLRMPAGDQRARAYLEGLPPALRASVMSGS